ncbi:MAG: polysaccharide biosynthesis tyrosine autokinase [Ruminococcaceae bacterium]|nr:polysaccharide biosynthesis tyrosine autokinase [Oscillospiraceae bacterium]
MDHNVKNSEISLAFLWQVFRRRIVWLAVALAVGIGVALAYTKLLVTPMYSSSADFFVENTVESSSSITSSYQSGAAQLASNYVYKIKGNVFLEEMTKEYNARSGSSLTVEELAGMVTVSSESNTPVFTVKVVSADPQMAYDILKVFEDKTSDLLKSENTKDYVSVEPNNRGELDTDPDSPNLLLNLAIGGFLTFLITYFVFFLRAFLDKTIYGEDALKDNFEIPVVGQIPQWVREGESAKRRKLIGEDIESNKGDANRIKRDYETRLLNEKTPFSVAESFKNMRTNLLYVKKKDDLSPIFGVTSGFSGAGKSIMIANIALSFAQLGKKVLLIDGDMRCPAQHKIFSLDKKHKGLSEALAGLEEKPFETCTVKVAEGVDLIPSGHIPPNPSELLSSTKMTELLNEAKAGYDYIFIDLPPLLETTDAGVLTAQLTGYVFVVRAGYSNINAVKTAIESLEAVGATLSGFLLNDVNYKRGYGYNRYGGKYSSYQHGQYGQE